MLNNASERRRVSRLRDIGLGSKTISMKAVGGFEEQGHLTVTLQATEAFLGVEDGRADPAAHHRAVSPARDASSRPADDAHQVFEGVRRRGERVRVCGRRNLTGVGVALSPSRKYAAAAS